MICNFKGFLGKLQVQVWQLNLINPTQELIKNYYKSEEEGGVNAGSKLYICKIVLFNTFRLIRANVTELNYKIKLYQSKSL